MFLFGKYEILRSLELIENFDRLILTLSIISKIFQIVKYFAKFQNDCEKEFHN